jgi:putative sterol carrier protein
MARSAQEFFSTLESRLDPAKLAGTTATYRFDIEGAGSWKVDVADGRLSVTETTDDALCVIRMKEEVFAKLLEGKQNIMTAFMLGKIKVEGDMGAAMKLKDLFA